MTVTMNNTKQEILDAYEELAKESGNSRYETIGRKAEQYVRREQSAKYAEHMDEARVLKSQLVALVEG